VGVAAEQALGVGLAEHRPVSLLEDHANADHAGAELARSLVHRGIVPPSFQRGKPRLDSQLEAMVSECARSPSPTPMTTCAAPTPVLSVVVPLLNEEDVLEETYRVLKQHLAALGERYEMVFVDDGSTERSRAILAAKSLADPTVRVVALARNFGHEMATTAGLHHARGQAVIVMDADLQDPPELIAQFLARWREGHEVVYGVRAKRERETALKKATSFLFYRLMRLVADVPIPADTGDFRLMDRRVLDVYAQLHE